jgi:hypothetical protein
VKAPKPKKESSVEANGSPARSVSSSEKEERVEAGAPPADECPEQPKKSEDVVAASPSRAGILSAAEPNKQVLGTSTFTREETEVGGS